MDTRDEELKASLLASFCPILRFDAAEKHFPVCAETFISCSVLLRRPKNPRQAKKEATRRRTRQADQQDEDDDDDEEEEDAAAHQRRQQEGIQHQQQACAKCGQRQGWSIPSRGGWGLVALPSGSESWSASALLEEQQRDRLHDFRLEPHCCIWNGQPGDLSTVPCYAFAELLDPSAMAPFIGRAGLGPVYELKYVFLYGYNGTTFAVPGTSVGVHTGDLEHVTIRVDAGRRMVLEAFFAAHGTGEGKWVPSREFHRQVEALEAAAHPGFTADVPLSTREFLEVEASTAGEAGGDGDVPEATPAEASGESGVGVRVGGGERLVIYPARNGHASYHMPKRWRRFVGLGDDVCGGDGTVWRPSPVLLDHPQGITPPWLRFRGRYGGTRSIMTEGFWKCRGEAPRRCSAEAKYRSLLEEGLVPDRGVRLGLSRRLLNGNGDRGVWLERRRQTQSRLPLLNMWTRVPGVSSSKPQDEDPPRHTDLVWLADWGFLRDVRGGTTDAQGWSYHSSQAAYADTGTSGRSKDSGILAHRSRGRVWFRVAATPQVAREVEEARRQDRGRHPRVALALAALDVAGRGDTTVTSASLLQTLRDGVHRRGGTGASPGAREGTPSGTTSSGAAAGGDGAPPGGSPRELDAGRSADELCMSFGSVAMRSIGGGS